MMSSFWVFVSCGKGLFSRFRRMYCLPVWFRWILKGMCRLCGKVWGDFGQLELRQGQRVCDLYWVTWSRVFQEPYFWRSAAVESPELDSVLLKMDGVRSSETSVQTIATRWESKKRLHEKYPQWQHPNVCMSLMCYHRSTQFDVSALQWFGS